MSSLLTLNFQHGGSGDARRAIGFQSLAEAAGLRPSCSFVSFVFFVLAVGPCRRLARLVVMDGWIGEQWVGEFAKFTNLPICRFTTYLITVTNDQIFGMLTFSIDCGCISACVRNAGRSRSAVNPM